MPWRAAPLLVEPLCHRWAAGLSFRGACLHTPESQTLSSVDALCMSQAHVFTCCRTQAFPSHTWPVQLGIVGGEDVYKQWTWCFFSVTSAVSVFVEPLPRHPFSAHVLRLGELANTSVHGVRPKDQKLQVGNSQTKVLETSMCNDCFLTADNYIEPRQHHDDRCAFVLWCAVVWCR